MSFQWKRSSFVVRVLFVLLLAMSVQLTMAMPTLGSAPKPTPVPAEKSVTPAQATSDSFTRLSGKSFGVTWVNQTNYAWPTSPDTVSQLGVDVVRVYANWGSIVGSYPDTPAWWNWNADNLDTVVNDLLARNIDVSIMIGGVPSWACSNYSLTPYRCGFVTDHLRWWDFTARLAQRYTQSNVRRVEILNEIDSYQEYGTNPEAYGSFLCSTYFNIKGVNPGLAVVMAGLAYDIWQENEQYFLTRMLAYNTSGSGSLHPCTDAINIHHYAAPSSAQSVWQPWNGGFGDRNTGGSVAWQVYRTMNRWNVGHLPVIVTETGRTGGEGDTSLLPQAAYAAKIIPWTFRAEFKEVHWYNLYDYGCGGGDSFCRHGVVRQDHSRKSAYWSYLRSTQIFSSGTYAGAVPATSFSGNGEGYTINYPNCGGCSKVTVAWNNSPGSWTTINPGTTPLRIEDMYGNVVYPNGTVPSGPILLPWDDMVWYLIFS